MTTPTLPPATPENPIRLVRWNTHNYVSPCELCRTTPEQSPGQWYYDIKTNGMLELACGDYCQFCAESMMAIGTAIDISDADNLDELMESRAN